MTTPTLPDDVVERALDAAVESGMLRCSREAMRRMFTAALGDSHTIVPKEPTEAMAKATRTVCWDNRMSPEANYGRAKAIYRAMLAAEKDGT